jgi:MFS family permease
VFVCNIVAGVSALFAAKLADRIGLILTMVVTHIPSNILLIMVPLMPNETLAIVMLCARFSISQMDSPTRNAYVQGVVHPDERSAANGITNVARSAGASTGPYLAGILFANGITMDYPWYIAGLLKILYDVLLLYNMQAVKPDVEIDKKERKEFIEVNRNSLLQDEEKEEFGGFESD